MEQQDKIGLAEFEIGMPTFLDEYTDASPNLLDEFESSRDIIFSLDPIPETPEIEHPDTQPGELSADTPSQEPQPAESDQALLVPTSEIEPREPKTDQPPEPLPLAYKPASVIGFVCKHSINLSEIMDPHGRMIGRTEVHLIEIPCAGMVKPEWLEHALREGASGVFVVACDPGSCFHRRGGCVFEGRWQGTREPRVGEDIDRNRARLVHAHFLARESLLKDIEKFLNDLDRLNSQGRTIQAEELIPELGETDPL